MGRAATVGLSNVLGSGVPQGSLGNGEGGTLPVAPLALVYSEVTALPREPGADVKREHLAAAAALGVVLLVLGVASRSDSADWSRRGERQAGERAFLHGISAAGVDVGQDGRDAWLEVGDGICAALRAGEGVPEVTQHVRNEHPSASARHSAAIVSAATNLCPEQG
jgi:hypothetical protein